ncbi:MAG: 23S rRNA (adenine(2503)-C(2))-methyltransferase RlmN [Gemmatimonadetes bacterium]|nr:23S rRNA (adenine(2503)-C(2))-methyltransferase RlmN [Gemmatimonadota bacterium]
MRSSWAVAWWPNRTPRSASGSPWSRPWCACTGTSWAWCANGCPTRSGRCTRSVSASPSDRGPMERADLLSLTPDQLDAVLAEHFRLRGQGAYRVGQTRAWLHERDALSFDELTDLPQRERDALAEVFTLCAPVPARVEQSADGTVKHLWRLGDGELVESVLIPSPERLTLCISSQAGCAMACVFCATGWSGYRRQLTAGEIVAQFRGARRYATERDLGAISNVVFMGMGEPLMNRKAVFPALTLLNQAYGMGARRITVSTVGVVPGIAELAARPEQFRLALSLHAPNHELRAQLVPLEKKYPLPLVLEALRGFEAAGGRRITFEYVLIDGLNDAAQHAIELAGLAGEFQSHVNLIPFNPIPGTDWRPTPPDRQRAFAEILEARGVPATIRSPRGRDIAAACGQLRAEHVTRPPRPYLNLVGLQPRPRGQAGP